VVEFRGTIPVIPHGPRVNAGTLRAMGKADKGIRLGELLRKRPLRITALY
jgi:hypothetical protein